MSICENIKKRYIRLSKGQRKVAQYVIDNPNVVATQVASEVGRLASVSESTVIRFCYAMGLSGYSDLQDKMKEYLIEKDGSIPAVPKTRTFKKQNIPFNEELANHMKDLLTVMQQTDERLCSKSIQLLHEAKDVFIIGFRDALPIAFSLYYELGQYRDRIHMLQHDVTKISTELVHMNESSLIIIVNTDLINEEAKAIAEIGHRKKVNIVTITDNKCESLEQYCKVAITVSKKDLLKDSTIAMYAFIQALVKCLVAQYDDEYKKKETTVGDRLLMKLIEVS